MYVVCVWAYSYPVQAMDMYERMFTMKFLPPGRGLWAMVSAIYR
jgi:hypothetical protein